MKTAKQPPQSDARTDERFAPVDAAAYLGLSVETLKRWRYQQREGGPRYIRVSDRKVQYRRSDLDAWIEENTVAN